MGGRVFRNHMFFSVALRCPYAVYGSLSLSSAQIERLAALPLEELRVLGFGEPVLSEHSARDLFKTLGRIWTRDS